MAAINLVFVLILTSFSESATIPKKNDTLEILKKDLAHVGSAVEDFTFDILREMIDNSEEQESTTVGTRQKRSVEDEVRNLCQKRCDSAERAEKEQIKDLKNEVKKLQEMVKLIQGQEKIIDILDQNNETKQTRADESDEIVPNVEELAKMKSDLKDVINKLNQTRELLNLQKEKDQILELELINQKEEIGKLKHLVDTILHNNSYSSSLRTSENNEGNRLHTARASELSGLRKLLKSLPEDEDEGDDDLRSKLLDLQKHLDKKRKHESLLKDLKQLEKGFNEDNSGDSDLMRQIIEAIKKTEPKSRNDDINIANLSDLQEAINRLRPKENEADQFQAMLNKLINRPANQRPSQITITPQQMSELTKKLTPNNSPYICIGDDGGVKNNGYKVPVNPINFPPPPPIDYNKGQQFFPGQFTQPNYYAQGNANGAGFEKPLAYPTENVDYNQKYQEDLRQQIDGLQAAIDNLNKPEYLQRPEDKAVVDDLERQIGDLRGIVNNLNYDPGYPRGKRSVDNNEVDNSKEMAQKVSNFVGKLLDKNNLTEIQSKINTIKKQLDSNSNTKLRASAPYVNPLQYPSAQTDPTAQELTRSFKSDFLSEIIGKILDKVIDAIPAVLQKLFGFTLEQLTKDDYQDYDVQTLRKNLGIFAVLPIILLRIVKGITTFMNVLRKSSFFKNFLMPAIILGTVAGAVLFLIWWLQPDDSPQYYIGGDSSDPNQYSPPNPNQYSPPNPSQYSPSNPSVSYNYPVYNRSYYNK